VGRPSPLRLAASRRIAADPTSTALLLAGPVALELWPGVRRIAEVGGRVLVEIDLPREGGAVPVAAIVAAEPPRRTPTAFVTRFSWTSSVLPPVSGSLTLSYAPGGHGAPSTRAALQLEVEQPADGDDTRTASRAALLSAMAEGFLDNLAGAAEQRRSAA
jgi:hypothetical protein